MHLANSVMHSCVFKLYIYTVNERFSLIKIYFKEMLNDDYAS